jgi:hypothetical protein
LAPGRVPLCEHHWGLRDAELPASSPRPRSGLAAAPKAPPAGPGLVLPGQMALPLLSK